MHSLEKQKATFNKEFSASTMCIHILHAPCYSKNDVSVVLL